MTGGLKSGRTDRCTRRPFLIPSRAGDFGAATWQAQAGTSPRPALGLTVTKGEGPWRKVQGPRNCLAVIDKGGRLYGQLPALGIQPGVRHGDLVIVAQVGI